MKALYDSSSVKLIYPMEEWGRWRNNDFSSGASLPLVLLKLTPRKEVVLLMEEFAISTHGVYTINYVKWAGEESGALPECIHFRLSRFILPFFPLRRPLEEGLGVIWCYRCCCYLGELLQVSGGKQSHAIPQTPIKAPAQRGGLLSPSGFHAGKPRKFQA